jgi:hydroxymethylpyrimidine pyrophosphatase-like HAD family hydrolase
MNKVGQSKGVKIIAVDFDDTLFERGSGGFPEIGKPIWKSVEYVLQEQRNGAKLILWTCRGGRYLIDAVVACENVGIKFDAINDDLYPSDIEGSSRKIYASEYFDDKSKNPLELW